MKTTFHILHADDDDEDRMMFRDALAHHGAGICLSQVANGVEALRFLKNALLKNELPSSIICDMSMPSMDGLELLKELKQHQQLKHIPVIMFSTSSSIFDRDRTRALGAQAFFSKPNTWPDFLATTRTLLQLCTHTPPTENSRHAH